MEKPVISVIVPVYKAQEYLPDCLASVRAQTFSGWECILVDDGSPDGSGALCDEAAAADSRFSVIHKQNAGVSAARNSGLEAARGDYIVFMDADDALAPCALALALNAAASRPEDLICWRLTRSKEELPDASFTGPVPETVYTPAQRRVYVTTVDGHSSCNKLFSAALLRESGLRFDTALAKAEDYMFVGAYLETLIARQPGAQIRQLEAPLYYWRMNPASVTNQKARGDRRGSVEWEPEEYRDYARRLAQEYNETRAAMNGWEGMSESDLAPQLRTYLRRFAFAVWAAGQLGETLPADFFTAGPVPELLDLLRRHRFFTPYYLLFRLRLKGLIARCYESEESGRLTLYQRLYTITYYILFACGAKRWQQA